MKLTIAQKKARLNESSPQIIKAASVRVRPLKLPAASCRESLILKVTILF
jgi:hypothetical protein